MRASSKLWTIVAAGGTTDVVYAGTYTVIETTIGISAIATGGGEIATAIENWGSLAKAREPLTARDTLRLEPSGPLSTSIDAA
jgi:hypothetical protein